MGKVIDVQDFDLDAVQSIHRMVGHFEMSASQYANPANKGAFVNKLDFVVLAVLEIDSGFNVNVLTGSDGVLRGAPSGHPDTAAGSKELTQPVGDNVVGVILVTAIIALAGHLDGGGAST